MKDINSSREYEDDHGNSKNMTIFDHSGKFLDDKVKPSNTITIKVKDILDEYEKEIRLLVDESIDNQELKNDLEDIMSLVGRKRYNKSRDITYNELKISPWLEPKEKELYIECLKVILSKYKLLNSKLLK